MTVNELIEQLEECRDEGMGDFVVTLEIEDDGDILSFSGYDLDYLVRAIDDREIVLGSGDDSYAAEI